MKKLTLLLFTLCCCLAPAFSLAPLAVIPQPQDFLQEEFNIEDVNNFATMSIKEIETTANKDLSLKEKIVLKIVQRKARRALKKGQTPDVESLHNSASGSFNIGGFLLGFLLGLIGVLLAIFFGGDAVRSALLGMLIWILAVVLIVL